MSNEAIVLWDDFIFEVKKFDTEYYQEDWIEFGILNLYKVFQRAERLGYLSASRALYSMHPQEIDRYLIINTPNLIHTDALKLTKHWWLAWYVSAQTRT